MTIGLHEVRHTSPKHQDFWSLSVFAPLKITIYYISITVFLHIFGPWTYSGESILPMLIFMSAASGMFALGYWKYARRWKSCLARDDIVSEANYGRLARFSFLSLLLQSILIVFAFGNGLLNGEVNFSDLLNPGKVYIDALAAGKDVEASVSYLTQAKTVLSPIFTLSNVFLIFNYRRIKSKWSRLLILVLVLQLLLGLLTKGAQKGLFDVFIMLASVGILKAYLRRQSYFRWRRYAFVFLILIVAVFIFFQVSRLVAYDALDFSGTSQSELDRNSILFTLFGDSIGLGLSLFIGYISQGYYGLSLTLQLPFEWSYGLGNSFAITSYAEQYLGIFNAFEKTYPYRMEQAYGWPAKMYWHTIFPWLASDLTFVGTVILMYFLGRAYAKSLIESVVYESPVGICIFYFLTTLVLYLPANNQLMQTREMMLATVGISIFWLAFGGRFKKPLKPNRHTSRWLNE